MLRGFPQPQHLFFPPPFQLFLIVMVVLHYITLKQIMPVATPAHQLILFLGVVEVRARMRVMVPLGVAVFMVAEVRLIILAPLGRFPVAEAVVELAIPITARVAQEM